MRGSAFQRLANRLVLNGTGWFVLEVSLYPHRHKKNRMGSILLMITLHLYEKKNREIRFVSSSSRGKFGAEPTTFLSKNWLKIRPLARWSTKYAFFHRYYCFIEFMYNTIVHSNLQLQKILLLDCYFKCLVVSFTLKWNLPIADIPNSKHSLNCSNILC